MQHRLCTSNLQKKNIFDIVQYYSANSYKSVLCATTFMFIVDYLEMQCIILSLNYVTIFTAVLFILLNHIQQIIIIMLRIIIKYIVLTWETLSYHIMNGHIRFKYQRGSILKHTT